MIEPSWTVPMYISDTFLIGIEDHMPRHSAIFCRVVERVLNANAVEARLADGVEQDVHGVAGKRGQRLRLLVEAGLEAAIEIEPARIAAGGIVGEDGFEARGGRSGSARRSGPSVR